MCARSFFTGDPEQNVGGAVFTVTATKPDYQAQWDGDARAIVEVVEGEPSKGNRKLATVVFVFDEKRKRFKMQ